MSEEQDQQKLMAQLKTVLRQALDEKAYERMMNVMLVNQELFANASQKILMLHQKIGRPITEKEVLYVLGTLKGQPKSGGISIKRK